MPASLLHDWKACLRFTSTHTELKLVLLQNCWSAPNAGILHQTRKCSSGTSTSTTALKPTCLLFLKLSNPISAITTCIYTMVFSLTDAQTAPTCLPVRRRWRSMLKSTSSHFGALSVRTHATSKQKWSCTWGSTRPRETLWSFSSAFSATTKRSTKMHFILTCALILMTGPIGATFVTTVPYRRYTLMLICINTMECFHLNAPCVSTKQLPKPA